MNKNKIKIVHIAQANGGVEVYLRMFFKYINKEKYDNYLILSEKYYSCKDYFEKLGVKVYIVNMVREINLMKDLIASIEIYRIVKKINPDIIYTHSSKAGGLGRIPAKLVGAKNIYNPHGWSFDMNVSKKKKMLFKYYEKILAFITDRVIAISKYEKDVAINKKIIRKDKISVIENAIDLENFKKKYNSKKIKKDLMWNDECIVIGMVARISEQKSPDTFVSIAKKLSCKYDKLRFLIVGDGEKREEIEKEIENNGLRAKFYITGWLDNPYEYLNIFDIAILTSRWEGFGLVIPEYMAAGKPIVASNVGGISNIIENEQNGYLVDDLNVNDFVSKIEVLMKNENIRENFVKNGFNTVLSKYDFRINIEKQEFIFDNIVKSK